MQITIKPIPQIPIGEKIEVLFRDQGDKCFCNILFDTMEEARTFANGAKKMWEVMRSMDETISIHYIVEGYVDYHEMYMGKLYEKYRNTPIEKLKKWECVGSSTQGVELHLKKSGFIEALNREPEFRRNWGTL